MKKFIFLKLSFCLFFYSSYACWPQDSTIITHGIPDLVTAGGFPTVDKYESSVAVPPFIDWGKNGKTLLFNSDSLLLEIKRKDKRDVLRLKAEHLKDACFSPDHKKFLYEEDWDGDENYQLFLYDISSQKSLPITQKEMRSYDPVWSPNGRKISFKANLLGDSVVDLFVLDIKNPDKITKVFSNITDDGYVLDWEEKTDQMLAVKVISENNKQLFIIDNKKRTAEQINPGAPITAYADAQFLPGKMGALVVSDKDSEFLQLHYYDFENKTFKNITGKILWDIDQLSIHKKGKKAVFTVNQNGKSILYCLDVNTLNYDIVEGLPIGVIRNLKISPKGNELAFLLLGSTFERKMYVCDLNTKEFTLFDYPFNETADSLTFVEAQSFCYPGYDTETGKSLSIPCFIYRPVKKSNTACPVLIDIHGGPEGQALPLFNAYHQFLVSELGIAVAVPNVRGSNGYGKSYMKADDWLNREKAVEDIGSLLEWIEKQNDLDHTRVAVYGGSYGGYMVLAALTHFPERIRCGIDIVGISNWLTYIKNTSAYRRDLRRVEYGDERIPEVRTFFEDISPVRNAWKIKSPLLIFQGLNDPRVNYKESEQMYQRLNDQGNVIWYLLAKDEGHGFRKPENLKLQRKIEIEFLIRFLLK